MFTLRIYADPIDLSINTVGLWLFSGSSDTNDRIKWQVSDGSHAVIDPKSPFGVRVAGVCSLIDEYFQGRSILED